MIEPFGFTNQEKLKQAITLLKVLDENAAEFRKQTATIWFDCIREKYNLTEGSTVRYMKKQYRVSDITIAFDWSIDRKPHCKGNPWNKEVGKYGLSERMLFDQWEVVNE
jgi:hypothetical protein